MMGGDSDTSDALLCIASDVGLLHAPANNYGHVIITASGHMAI